MRRCRKFWRTGCAMIRKPRLSWLGIIQGKSDGLSDGLVLLDRQTRRENSVDLWIFRPKLVGSRFRPHACAGIGEERRKGFRKDGVGHFIEKRCGAKTHPGRRVPAKLTPQLCKETMAL